MIDEKTLQFLYELKKILSSDNLRWEIAYSRDACNLEDEERYVSELFENLNNHLFELELKNGG